MRNDADFTKLYKAEHERLVSFASFALEDRNEAQDLVQQCFLRLWQKWDTFPDRENPVPYLFAAVRNAIVDYWRRDIYKRESALKQPAVTVHESHQIDLPNGERIAAIYKAIDSLPDKCRQVLVLFYFGEKSYAEIAAMMGISVHTVNNQKARAIRLLKKGLTG